MMLFEKFISTIDERRKLEGFIPDYANLKFKTIPIENKIRNNDTMTGDYYSKYNDYEVKICFYLSDEGDWVISVDGSNLSQSLYLKENFYYKTLSSLIYSLKVNFLNLDENSELEIYLENNLFKIKNTKGV
jgi:hypothetical protein